MQFLSRIERKSASNWRSWVYGAGLAISLACLFYFGERVLSMRDNLQFLPQDSGVKLPLAIAVYLLSYFCGAWAWGRLLKLLGTDISLYLATGIHFTTQFGKYLPGNVAHHIGRVALAKQQGLTPAAVITSMMFEFVLVLAMMLLFSLPVLLKFVEPGPVWLLVGSVAAAMIVTFLWYRWRDLNVARDIMSERLSAMPMLPWSVPIMTIAFCPLFSGGAVLLLDAGFTERPETLGYVVSVFCAAWVAGFLTPGAPAGLGVRELVLSEGLAPIVGMERAMAAAILLRFVSTIADLIAFSIGLMLLRYSRPKKTTTPPFLPTQSGPSH